MGLSRADVQRIAVTTGRSVKLAWSDHHTGEMGNVRGVVLHHTGTRRGGSASRSLRVVREGRSDLQNALCHWYIDDDGVIWCITNGIAWHAGAGVCQDITDLNGHLLGIEAESDGVSWTAACRTSYVLLVGAILRFLDTDQRYAPRHAQCARPLGRKTDFAGMDEGIFRADVENVRLHGVPTKPTPPTAPRKGREMRRLIKPSQLPPGTVLLVDGMTARWVVDGADLKTLQGELKAQGYPTEAVTTGNAPAYFATLIGTPPPGWEATGWPVQSFGKAAAK